MSGTTDAPQVYTQKGEWLQFSDLNLSATGTPTAKFIVWHFAIILKPSVYLIYKQCNIYHKLESRYVKILFGPGGKTDNVSVLIMMVLFHGSVSIREKLSMFTSLINILTHHIYSDKMRRYNQNNYKTCLCIIQVKYMIGDKVN